MLIADHPNALWLDNVYSGAARIGSDKTLDEETRARLIQDHVDTFKKRFAPNLIIHTGGVRLAATGVGAFVDQYIARRGSLCDANVVPLEMDQILADDHYGIIHGVFRLARGANVWERVGMGAWRFEDGMAMEHWELSNGPRWDAFFLATDPDFEGTAEEFWTKAT